MTELKKDNLNLMIDFIKENPLISSKEIHLGIDINEKISYATLKRILQKLISENLIQSFGKGKGTKYSLNPGYDLLRYIDIEKYFEKEIDERKIQNGYNFSLIQEILPKVELFSVTELNFLQNLQNQFEANISTLSDNEFKKEMERLAIDLSWKSSQIEGNTYSLLETERLLKEKKTTSGKTKDEAVMLLNHKDALDFIVDNPSYIDPLSISCIEDIHSILIKELQIERNIRKRKVGISGTNYSPIDNEFQIKDALIEMCNLVNNQNNVFSKALLVLVLISYIQAFSDGNKRTARIISNAILIQNNYCPISFRTVDSIEYKKAMLLFYEQNNIYAFKQIFMNQFEFAVNTYF